MPGKDTIALFDEARRLGVGFHLGYCELDHSSGRKRRFNSSILVGADGAIIGKYRKIHLPGHSDHRPGTPFQNLEKRIRVGERDSIGAPTRCGRLMIGNDGAGPRLIA